MHASVCRRCDRPVDQSNELVSRHRTSEGTVVYTRCACGLLHVWLDAEPRSARLVARARNLDADDRNELAIGL
jgi:RNase P subunit RPR2